MNDLDVCICRHFRIDHSTTLAPDIYLSCKSANVGDSPRIPSRLTVGSTDVQVQRVEGDIINYYYISTKLGS